jgi:hypothetical protein
MQVGDEVIWSTVGAIIVGITLKSIEFFINRKNSDSAFENQRIKDYHDSVEEELQELRNENRKLRVEADEYRRKYLDLLELRYVKPKLDTDD